MSKKSDTKEQFNRAKQRLEDQAELEELLRRQTLLRKRIELANSGVRHYENKNMKEAVKAFHSYIRILEFWKGCPEGGLKPSLFDLKVDTAELLLISGVYWDLVKLYDRTESAKAQKEFYHYMEKFVLFTKGMPFAALSTESLRKYIANDKATHKGDFKAAYKTLGGSDCFIASVLVDVLDPETMPRLREFRDHKLIRSILGRVLVRTYYYLGPWVAYGVEILPMPLRRGIGRTLDYLGKKLVR